MASIMVQGTMSSAGKSFLAAALCRIFKQDGYKTAPFKSQNMALNSFITKDGLEMGRAQVMQAEAAEIDCDVRMNPILLKPTTEMGSQVIVMGKPVADMRAADYFKFKHKLIPDIMTAYNSLKNDFDIIVIEGAGSPAEINLKENDIVNMGLAKLTDSPVLLAADIDRGGVFAQIYGTVMLLEEEERKRIKGIIINKFRGDKKILDPGIKMIEEKCGIPVVGVIPYMNVDVDDEDSLSDRLENKETKGLIDIAVIRLPKISNFTDFNSLETIDGFSVRYVSRKGEIKEPDLIIVPGSKSTIADLKWLRQSGIEGEIKRLAHKGTLIWGICGGYQMLGQKISDPLKTETGGEIEGMGLLKGKTVFEEEKTRTRIEGKILADGEFSALNGVYIEGYEIHMGETKTDGEAFSIISDGKNEKTDGEYLKNVCGSYVHGMFDSDDMRAMLKKMMYERKGISAEEKAEIGFKEYKIMQYNIMAENVRKNMDMEKIYNIMGIKR